MRDILIIGGNSGVGEKLLQRLLDLPDVRLYTANRTGWEDTPSDVTHQTYDAADGGSVLQLPEVLHGLVYLPGSITLKPFDRLDPAAFAQDMEVNLYGLVRVLKQALPALRRAESASVVSFSTVAVQQGLPFHASIAAAKGAVEGLFRSLAAEYAPRVRFNVIAPSLTDTPLAAALLNSERKREAAEQRHPLKSVGDPDHLAAMAALLLSDEGSWITGQVIGIDGGMSAIR
jgi:3-oxoacyl-[acyl-carrier protein] reductase